VSWTNDYPAFPDARCAADARWTAAVRETFPIIFIHLKKSMRKEWYSPASKDKSAMEAQLIYWRDKQML